MRPFSARNLLRSLYLVMLLLIGVRAFEAAEKSTEKNTEKNAEENAEIANTETAGAELAKERAIGPARAEFQRTVSRAVEYFRAQQADDGSYSGFSGPGVTALVTTALLRQGLTPRDPTIQRSLRYLEGFAQPDGGIYAEGSLYRNYETCLTMLCFAEANQDGRYRELLMEAERYVKQLQWDEGEGHDRASTSFGGAGYGKHKRPDLSNSSVLIETLKAMGNGPDDEHLQNALIFVSRCQNEESAYNKTEFSTKNPDGGFYYTPAAGGSSPAGETPNGGLRSYGSMTYAGLKSMIYAGVGEDDPRVQAALSWIQQHYDLTENPGLGRPGNPVLGQAGLYYYYHTFAKALSATGLDLIHSSDGQDHDWRRELAHELARRQRSGGSWVNQNSRWLEGDPNLVTGYALLALSYCRAPSK